MYFIQSKVILQTILPCTPKQEQLQSGWGCFFRVNPTTGSGQAKELFACGGYGAGEVGKVDLF